MQGFSEEICNSLAESRKCLKIKQMLLALSAWLLASGAIQAPVDLLARVAEEAEVLAQNAPRALAQETLEQRALVRTGSRIRIGKAATQPPKEELRTRTIVSEYSVAPLKGSESKDLLEFREVVSVDGKAVRTAESARHTLSLGIRNPDERVRKRMLEDFAHYGIEGAATDYAMILLAFTPRGQRQLVILPSGEDRIGTDDAFVFAWRQAEGSRGELLFAGTEAMRVPLQGEIWVRKSDGRPLRIWVWAEQPTGKSTIRDEATVDYVMSPHGFVAPVSVHHLHLVDGKMTSENLYRYEPFKLFAAESELKFSVEPPVPQAPPPR
jgi:hypothetical protein